MRFVATDGSRRPRIHVKVKNQFTFISFQLRPLYAIFVSYSACDPPLSLLIFLLLFLYPSPSVFFLSFSIQSVLYIFFSLIVLREESSGLLSVLFMFLISWPHNFCPSPLSCHLVFQFLLCQEELKNLSKVDVAIQGRQWSTKVPSIIEVLTEEGNATTLLIYGQIIDQGKQARDQQIFWFSILLKEYHC